MTTNNKRKCSERIKHYILKDDKGRFLFKFEVVECAVAKQSWKKKPMWLIWENKRYFRNSGIFKRIMKSNIEELE